MKEEMSAFDILAMTSEMQYLVGGYMEKVFQWEGKNMLIRINTQEKGKKELLLQGMRWLYISGERPKILTSFPVRGEPSKAIHQLPCRRGQPKGVRPNSGDRPREGTCQLQIDNRALRGRDLFLVSENKILNSVYSRKWKHREIRPGIPYEFPASRFDPRTMDLVSFRKTLLTSSSDVIRTLATTVNIGGQYAEEICLRTGIEKERKAKTLTDEEIGKMFELLAFDASRRPRQQQNPER